MKRMKALLGVVLVIAMVLALSVTAFAANGGKIIVAEPGDHTYQIYKIFDAEKTGTEYTYKCNNAALEALINDETDGFHDLIIDPTTKEVTKTSTFSAAEFAAWLADREDANELPAILHVATDQTSTQMGAGVTVDDGGYYYISYDNGRPYALTTVYGEDVQIQNKHDTPFDKDVYKADTERTAGTPSHDEKSVQLGDTLYYQITGKVVDTGTNTQYNYLVWDRLGEGLKLVNNTVKVYVAALDTTGAPDLTTKTEITSAFAKDTLNTTPIASTPKDTIWENTTGTYNDVTPSFVVNVDMNRLNNLTPAIKDDYAIIIEYEALVTEDLGVLVNTAHLVSNDLVKDAQTQNYVSQILVDKFETGNASQKLAGAKFILQNNITGDADNGKYYQVTYNKPSTTTPVTYTPTAVVGELPDDFTWDLATDVNWVDDEANATVMVTTTDGSAVFSGLKDGDYKLYETAAPDGYVRLEQPVELTVNGKASLDPKNQVDNDTTQTKANQEIQLKNVSHVANTPGSVLPSTGGRGTTMLYMAGLAMMLAAGAFLIFRRRAEAGK